MDAVTIADQEYVTAMERGSLHLLNAIKLSRGDFTHRLVAKAFTRSDFLWRNAPVPENQWSGDGNYTRERLRRHERVALAMAEKDRIAEARRVNRDPCPKCGVRSDIGCRHSK